MLGLHDYIQIAGAFVGALGFALVFRLRKGLLPAAAIGGMLEWTIYLISYNLIGGTAVFWPSMIASLFCSLYSEVMARKMKAPSTIFLVPGLIPLIPGKNLYYVMSYAVQNDWKQMQYNAAQLVQFALGIVAGAAVIWVLVDFIRRIKNWEQS
ncbi:MAG: threonine/serine exporter family protein [Eubacteriales bacterium]|jgi:uncharacterized membrane protein YjjB (DUF3815 family)|uniref:Threonine/serine exporter n=1 Tax=Baileyella intestinalis TaxID=2606709 RepID=A0A6A8MC09_9FIRM|nr:threonine/serine exporter family protein [Baileyella intestinalis]MST68987.1 threonine/serine exporter [Baileyella intestinalis]